mgnify:CR=1 FL=1|jgi:hypothetical protein
MDPSALAPDSPEGSNDASAADDAAAPDDGGSYRDELPADLDITALVGPVMFPTSRRRWIAAALYAGAGALALVLWVLRRNDNPVLVNAGVAWAGVALLVLALWHAAAAWKLNVDQTDALIAATRHVGFPVGHASAQLGWRGLRSRPTWNVLVYSNDEPPSTRGLVRVDGVNGNVVEHFVEENPEDWSTYVTNQSN